MNDILTLITVTKDDLEGFSSTISSTRRLREDHNVRQVVVDSSGEQTRRRVEEVLSREHNIDYVWQPPSGIAAAFNKGLSISKADWIWFLNGKDEVLPDLDPEWFLKLIRQCSADAIVFDLVEDGKKWKHPPLWEVWPPVVTWIPHPATLTRRSLYQKHGNFDESLKIAMDYEFWLRCFSKDVTVDMVSIPVVKFDGGGISCVQTADTSGESLLVMKKHLWTLVKKWLNHGSLLPRAWLHFVKRRNKGQRA